MRVPLLVHNIMLLIGVSINTLPNPSSSSTLPSSSSVTLPSSSITLPSSSYDDYSTKYDVINSGITTQLLGIDAMRSAAGEYASGSTLEIAIGTALQSDYYDWNKIRSFYGIDNSIGMLDIANNKIKSSSQSKVPIELTTMDATQLAYQSNNFDTVIDTFSMCVFPEPSQVLKEMVRVVKDNGKIILLENSVSTNPILRSLQDLFEPIVTPYSKNCRWNVDVPELAKNEGLKSIEYKDIQSGTIMLGVYTKNK